MVSNFNKQMNPKEIERSLNMYSEAMDLSHGIEIYVPGDCQNMLTDLQKLKLNMKMYR